MHNVIIKTDGGSRGNPGHSAIGFVIWNDQKLLYKKGEYIGIGTNNQAEYLALINALQQCISIFKQQNIIPSSVSCKLDSELVVKQLNFQYKVKDKKLAPLFLQVINLSRQFNNIAFTHIPREQNKEADTMVNRALDMVEASL